MLITDCRMTLLIYVNPVNTASVLIGLTTPRSTQLLLTKLRFFSIRYRLVVQALAAKTISNSSVLVRRRTPDSSS